MLLDRIKEILDIELVNEDMFEELYNIYTRNIEDMRCKVLTSGKGVYEFQTDDAKDIDGKRLYFVVKIGGKSSALMDIYENYPEDDSVMLKYFIVDKDFKGIEVYEEILRDFISLAHKEYKTIYHDVLLKNQDEIEIYKKFGFVEDSLSQNKIRLKHIDLK